MNRQEYLEKLRRALAQMPPGELEKQIAYYDELISDMCEDGMSETEAVAKLGDPAAVAAELLTALPLGTLVKFPLWFPLLVSFGAVLLSLLVTLWSLVLSFAAVVLSLGIAAIAAPFALVFGYVEGSPLMIIGASLAAAGLCVLGAAALPLAVRGSARLCRAVGRGIKSIFIKKEK